MSRSEPFGSCEDCGLDEVELFGGLCEDCDGEMFATFWTGEE